MPTLNDLVRRHAPDLGAGAIEWFHQLVGDWQLVSDLSFADLVLWVREPAGGWVAVAHCRPSTGPTVHYHDVVGSRMPADRADLDRAYELARIVRDHQPEWYDDIPVRREAIPVLHHGRVLGVVSRNTNLAAARTPSRLELTYLQCADDLALMIASGHFPGTGAPTGSRRGAPRVGDGLLRLDREGRIRYASPNALSAMHRFGYVGDLVEETLSEVVTPLLDSSGGPVDESLPLVLSGRAPWRSDLESRGATLSVRAIPLIQDGDRIGALLLLRDVSELRRRERELLTKDATIREVHHRVKNNLQTVAALLRLQARRIGPGEGQSALQEAMRRVATIALVHETLSEGTGEMVDFDAVVSRTASLAVELAATAAVQVHRQGSFGRLQAENATPLALVLTELVTNAVEHGLGAEGGQVTIRGRRQGQLLQVEVEDDGAGLPEGFVAGSSGLGTQIVQALLGGDLRGRIDWERPEHRGTLVRIEVSLRAIVDPVDGGGPTAADSEPGGSAEATVGV
jgi:two-component system, sensor histidine kinase PdtaS